jgi:2-keto-4-pentenoate hydratase
VLQSPAAWQAPGPDEVVIEAEIAFRLGRTPASAADIVASLGTVCVAIEIVGTRLVGGLTAPGTWKLADQGLHANLVIGAELAYAPFARFTPEDWAGQASRVQVNGKTVAETRGTHPTGDPLSGLAGLFDHAARHTGGLRAGDIVTTGAWIIEKVRPGDLVDVDFPGFGSAQVRIQG